MAHTSWQDMPVWQRRAVMVLAPLELALTTFAAVDLARRPRARVRGPKALWWPVLLIQPVGPVAYLISGRRGE
ncbi:PLD nuclease N-terminal domain-containing protein [Actinoplanes sp. NPDC024001]|uniref:PLD nuclease N-terminal domain-containing protein n=1 Tax=Actinoplanes sp. NPDC024001 TaxID=3154598 RepID=UPI0033FD4538